MKILKIVGGATDDERAALDGFVSRWESGKSWGQELLSRCPIGRVEVHVLSRENRRGIIYIDPGVVGFRWLDEPEPPTLH